MRKERPVNLSADEAMAILAGKKTQLRRVLKTQPTWGGGSYRAASGGWSYQDSKHKFSLGAWFDESDFVKKLQEQLESPFGVVGERLWGRETWSTHAAFDAMPPSSLTTRSIHYWAKGKAKTGKRRTSISMPRWASRISLEITNIRIERLNDISQADAIAEGAPRSHSSIDAVSKRFGFTDFSRSWFAQSWDLANCIGSWDKNPWVWVVEFKVAQGDAVRGAA